MKEQNTENQKNEEQNEEQYGLLLNFLAFPPVFFILSLLLILGIVYLIKHFNIF